MQINSSRRRPLTTGLFLATLASLSLGFAKHQEVCWTAAVISITTLLAQRKEKINWQHLSLASVPIGTILTAFGIPWQIAPIGTVALHLLATRDRRNQTILKEHFKIKRLKPSQITVAIAITIVACIYMQDYLQTRFTLIHLTPWISPIIQLTAASLTNAAAEEIVFRAAIISLPIWRSNSSSIIFSACIFGIAHWSMGIPSGLEGALASGLYGLPLAWLYQKTQSITLPTASHFVVNCITLLLLI